MTSTTPTSSHDTLANKTFYVSPQPYPTFRAAQSAHGDLSIISRYGPSSTYPLYKLRPTLRAPYDADNAFLNVTPVDVPVLPSGLRSLSIASLPHAHVASLTSDRSLYFWNMSTNLPIACYPFRKPSLSHLDLSPDASRILVTTTHRPPRPTPSPSSTSTNAQIHPTDPSIHGVIPHTWNSPLSNSGDVTLFDVTTFKPIYTLRKHATHVKLRGAGSHLALCADERSIFVHDLREPSCKPAQLTQSLESTSWEWFYQISTDFVSMLLPSSITSTSTLSTLYRIPLLDLAADRDANTVVSVHPRSVALFDLRKSNVTRAMSLPCISHPAVDMTPDGSRFVISGPRFKPSGWGTKQRVRQTLSPVCEASLINNPNSASLQADEEATMCFVHPHSVDVYGTTMLSGDVPRVPRASSGSLQNDISFCNGRSTFQFADVVWPWQQKLQNEYGCAAAIDIKSLRVTRVFTSSRRDDVHDVSMSADGTKVVCVFANGAVDFFLDELKQPAELDLFRDVAMEGPLRLAAERVPLGSLVVDLSSKAAVAISGLDDTRPEHVRDALDPFGKFHEDTMACRGQKCMSGFEVRSMTDVACAYALTTSLVQRGEIAGNRADADVDSLKCWQKLLCRNVFSKSCTAAVRAEETALARAIWIEGERIGLLREDQVDMLISDVDVAKYTGELFRYGWQLQMSMQERVWKRIAFVETNIGELRKEMRKLGEEVEHMGGGNQRLDKLKNTITFLCEQLAPLTGVAMDVYVPGLVSGGMFIAKKVMERLRKGAVKGDMSTIAKGRADELKDIREMVEGMDRINDNVPDVVRLGLMALSATCVRELQRDEMKPVAECLADVLQTHGYHLDDVETCGRDLRRVVNRIDWTELRSS